MRKEILPVIVGPTASGKTAAAVLAAKQLNAEVISADSIQVYRDLDIGSAKPDTAERDGIVHHMIDIVEADEREFSVARFKELTDACIADIRARGKVPLVAGGTGLYINSLTFPLKFAPPPGDETIRKELEALEAQDPGFAHRELAKVDPESAARLHPNDKKRVIRALEVYRISGKPMSEHGADFTNQSEAEPPYPSVIVGLTMPRELLYERIERRVDIMVEQGLVEEVRRLYDRGLTDVLPALQALGYRQLLRHFEGQYTLDEAIAAIKIETRHFAKRQLTWFRRDKRINWLDVTEFPSKQALADKICDIFERA